jgi:DNA-binding MurR/RpiR family transcriptional regulator
MDPDAPANQAPTLAQAVRAKMDGLTPRERKAAKALLAQYPVIGLEPVAVFAQRAHVSAPTILRLIGKLGLSGYPEFQRRLRDELTQQAASPLAKQRFPAEGRGKAGDALSAFGRALVENIEESFQDLPPGEFEEAVKLLSATNRRIYLVGGRFTDAIARYAAAQLRIVRPGVTHLIGQSENWRDQLLDFRAGDVLILFDIRRYQEDLLQLAGASAARKVAVILITDQWLSPVARHASSVLPTRVSAPSNWDSSVALLAIMEALIAATTETLWDSARERIETLEEMRRLAD